MKSFNYKDIIKLICIVIIGISNALTVFVLLRGIFLQSALSIIAVGLVIIVSVCLIIITLVNMNNKKKQSLS